MTEKQRLKPKNSSSLYFFATFDTLLDHRGAKVVSRLELLVKLHFLKWSWGQIPVWNVICTVLWCRKVKINFSYKQTKVGTTLNFTLIERYWEPLPKSYTRIYTHILEIRPLGLFSRHRQALNATLILYELLSVFFKIIHDLDGYAQTKINN